MLVPDHMAQLKECYRVLKKDAGAYAVFSVWGIKEKTHMFTILPKVMSKYKDRRISRQDSRDDTKAETPEIRSNFHLGQDDKALRYKIIHTWRDVVQWHIH